MVMIWQRAMEAKEEHWKALFLKIGQSFTFSELQFVFAWVLASLPLVCTGFAAPFCYLISLQQIFPLQIRSLRGGSEFSARIKLISYYEF